MNTRTLTFGLYADEEGLTWVRQLVADATTPRSARIIDTAVAHTLPGGMPTTEMYDILADQWGYENPGRNPGTRELVELRVRLACSLRTWRAIRKTLIRTLCPEGMAPHTCRVPWFAA
ncbi:hypothetical protein SGFS_034190 [Streptomyces graminofaciens]|uniref:Transposase n=1 Tax=Streptomyces graminofaciens TaxID=68212 RepID=A0ABM7F8Q3_9ACTN|nr:hypothetical protein [Streptomyces graminofaciens]BBC32125.1 hypothetical protein SGFS_034190 [Streptomyces graminofaciens]